MRSPLSRAPFGAAVLIVLLVLGSLRSAADESQKAEPGRSPGVLVRTALKAGASGDGVRRDDLLGEALKADPEYAPARWHSGHIRVEGEWLSVEEAERRAAADERLAEYRRLRQTHAGTPQGELALARFCRDNGLPAEAKVHWLHVLQADPDHKEALKSLGMRWYQGRLLTPAQIEQAKKMQAQAEEQRHQRRQVWKRWQKHWRPLVHRWEGAIEQGDPEVNRSIEQELRAVDDPAAWEALAAMVQERSGAKGLSQAEAEARRQLSLKLVEVLDGFEESWAVPSLVCHAVFHPIPEVRAAAADALGKRPMESYVPLLLSGTATPIEAHFVVTTYPGSVLGHYSLYREGAKADLHQTGSLFMLSLLAQRWSETLYLDGHPPPGMQHLPQYGLQSIRGALAARAAGQAQRQIEGINATIGQLNARILSALSRATGVDLGADPMDWWEWWEDRWYALHDLEKPHPDHERGPPSPFHKSDEAPEKPVYRCHFVKRLRVVSCFGSGTKVWTATGPTPIEEIEVGDRVLSQYPETGELAYKPVLETTTRDPSPMVKVHLGSDTIEATRGHMFFVSGEGWRMARELERGERLRALRGAAPIDALEKSDSVQPWYEQVEETPEAGHGHGSAYNLIVDDFHTFFVGDERILVQDNTRFGMPLGQVPGLPPY